MAYIYWSSKYQTICNVWTQYQIYHCWWLVGGVNKQGEQDWLWLFSVRSRQETRALWIYCEFPTPSGWWLDAIPSQREQFVVLLAPSWQQESHHVELCVVMADSAGCMVGNLAGRWHFGHVQVISVMANQHWELSNRTPGKAGSEEKTSVFLLRQDLTSPDWSQHIIETKLALNSWRFICLYFPSRG